MFRYAIAACVALTLAGAVEAQSSSRTKVRGKVARMEIFNGGTQVVRYFGEGLTPGEQSTLRDLERLENETQYARGLIALKQQYVNDERLLEIRRRIVQNQLYGVDITAVSYGGGLGFAGGFGGGSYGRAGLLSGYAYTNYGYPVAAYGLGSYGGYGGFGAGRQVNYSLANGVGYEGAIKNALSQTLAQQATPEYTATLERAFDRAALRAVSSPTLQVALNLPTPRETSRERQRDIATVGYGDSGPVTLTMKNGDKLSGEKLDDSGKEFWKLTTKTGQIRVRISEVVLIDEVSAKKPK